MPLEWIEAVVTWRGERTPQSGADAEVAGWLATAGFSTVPLQVGLLVSGPVALFRQRFPDAAWERLASGGQVECPVPAALAAEVESIVIAAFPEPLEPQRPG